MSILIQEGTLILPDGPCRADLRVEGGKITQIGPMLPPGDSQVLYAGDKLVFPGFIDTHTHFEMNQGLPNQTADDWSSGSRAALAGGTTTVLDFAEAERGAPLSSALKMWRRRADGHSSCHYGFHMTVKGYDPTLPAQLAELFQAGVTSFKVYFAYDNLRLSDADAYQVVRAVGQLGGIVGCHCENGDLVAQGIAAMHDAGRMGPEAHPASRPPLVEAEAVDRWLAIGEMAGYPVNIVHLSTARALEVIRAARRRGQALYVESCPQYFLLNDREYLRSGFEGAKFVLSPPLRKEEDQQALWQALAGGEVDTIGTDHCSFHFDGVKTLGREDFARIPNGIPGVEHRVPLLYTAGVAGGRISPLQLTQALSERPARLFGLYPQKGVLAVGSDADVVIFDPNYTGCISADRQYQNVDYTPYEGFPLRGRVETVLLDGQLAVEDGRVVLEGAGRYLRRGPCQFWR